MSIYKRDDVFPEWEPIPWDMSGEAADEQEREFHKRAMMPIMWRKIPWKAFPSNGIFGHGRDWFASNEIAYFAIFDDEEFILIQNPWHGFPDPPEWGLASRPNGKHDDKWSFWGHFPKLPEKWTLIGETE